MTLAVANERIAEAAAENSTTLDLSFLGLAELPPEIRQLTSLTHLDLTDNELSTLPPEIRQLTSLTQLNLMSNQLNTLPPEIGQLTSLTQLSLNANQFSTLPPEITQLTSLTYLNLSHNELSTLPPEITQLTSLTELNLMGNQLSTLPPEIRQLTSLTQLDLSGNELSTLPPEITQLTSLTQLNLMSNQLSTLPPEITQLTNLYALWVSGNELDDLPLTLADVSIQHLEISNNPFKRYPPEIREQGQAGILAYLKELASGHSQRWLSKLLVVGEGGVGKTSLLRALRGETFAPNLATTHGIVLETLVLPHPQKTDVNMTLKTWDFGGQDIYHATHQFFLTNRSLFLVAWNARLGYEQGRLHYWLDTIKALAPESPILLVATHTDEREARLPLNELKQQYPELVAQVSISNKQHEGIDTLRQHITEAAMALPLMGEIWPDSWKAAAEKISTQTAQHITPQGLYAVMSEQGVAESSAPLLARWLHELGELLFFQDSAELKDLVILQPQWVTEHISQVLENEGVANNHGIFTRECMETVWQNIDPGMREHFLRLMEQFDLSYRILEEQDKSLVVERLGLDPVDYTERWDAIKQQADCREVSLHFELGSLQPGIPTWFIARSHRFTLKTHWRYGALFGDTPKQPKHLGLVRVNTHQRSIELSVRGPHPHNFFALLKDGLELTLARFPGLDIKRTVPCPGHEGEPCQHRFNYSQLLKRKKPDIECPETEIMVSVPGMLYGWEWNTQDEVLKDLAKLKANTGQMLNKQDQTLDQIHALTELSQRQFLYAYRAEQSKIDAHCPNVFSLRPEPGRNWVDTLRGNHRLTLQLYCQQPGCWHPLRNDDGETGVYHIDEPGKLLKNIGPFVRQLSRVFKYTKLLGVGLNWFDDSL